MSSKKSPVLIIIICLLSVLLIVCGVLLYYVTTTKNNGAEKSRDNSVQDGDTEEELVDSVDYTIERDDLSFENKERELYLTQYYEKVVITTKGKNFKNINSLIQKQSDRFLDEAKGNEYFVRDEEYISNMNYSNYCSAAVTKNSDGVLSIKMTRTWFMGGVSNIDSWGLNYDLTTGEELSISDYLGMSKSETEKYFKEESKKQIQDGFFEDAAKTIDSYVLEDFNYYLKNNSIFICYSTYELAPGVAGAIIMEIPIPTTNK